MKKKILSVLLAMTMVASLAACDNGGKASEESSSSGAPSIDASKMEEAAQAGADFENGKFKETKKIVVEIYDRGNDGGSDPENNLYTDYIKKGMLEDHNVEVTFKKVPRWTEVDEINNLLAAGTAPDVCVTYSYPTIQTYANMGGVIDLAPYIEQYKSEIPNLWNWLGETNIYWDRDPKDGTLWCVEAKLAVSNRVITFVRQDWLDKLGLKAPTTKAEFESMLVAFKDNASTLLGSDASKIVPYSVSYDVGWRAATLIESFLDPAMSDKEYYVNGFDDRKLTQNGTKEGVRLLNKWYNMGLMWNDFAQYGSGDTTEDDMMKAGFVGAFTHNWDYPYRNGDDSINANLQRNVGPNAKFVAIDPFEDKNGTHTKFVSGPIDRKVFFPATNDEPLASLLYLDWISAPEHIQYLQIGDEGVTHDVTADGAIQVKAATGNAIMNSGMNIDYTITVNGLKLTSDELTNKSRALNYPGIPAEDVVNSHKIANTDLRVGKNVNVGAIEAEEGIGDTLSQKRDIAYDKAVVASTADFDKVWDEEIKNYLSAGGQAIIDERTEKWEEFFGSSDMLK
ncbi:MAG: extracellular solute-binding protein [Lachnospiraceae bacterium]|nr:extracellular solute-binding protein [Lachnospiraceae bacterium]MBP5264693.1 extracellular solute-binding protein [Lachnospiraceae bacterium]MBP5733891.1 extracellular solute-binding protein [Lachnospiraceae bacterium]